MVGVVVGDEDAGDRHVVGRGDLEQVADPVGRVDDQASMLLAIADQIGEVDHLGRQLVRDGEVASREQLAEVQGGHRQPSRRS